MVTVGGTGAIIADGVNVKSFVTNANPFTPGGGNYLEVQKITDSGGGLYSPVLFTFASDSNSWDGWQGSNVLDATFGSGECIALHGAQDVFFRVNTNSDSASVGGVNNLFCIRTIEQYSWSDGGNGLKLVLNGQNNGSMIFQIQNAGNNDGLGPDAIVNVTTSGGNISANPLYDIINMNFTDNGNLLTNGLAYHVAFSLNTDTNGLTKAAVYLKQGTGAIDPVQDMQGWATFNIIATNLLNINSSSGNVLPTQQCFTNQPWNFGVGWANDGKQFVCDYASPRSYNSVPASFTALPGSASETLSSAPPQTNVIFQADFKGAGGGTGGANDMVTVGGTGAIIADGVNVKSFVTNANPFTPGGGNYLEVQKITDSGGGLYSPVLFTFASDSNSWDGWQGSNVLDATFGSGECIALHGAQDVFFRVNTNSDSASVGGVNNLFCIRTIEQYSWSDGGNGLKLVLNGQNNGSMIFQIQNAGNNDGLGPDAIVNVTTSGGNISANPLYDIINMNFTDNGNLLTNGLAYHVAFSLNTDTNGLTKAAVYLKQGTGAIDPVQDMQGWATFNIIATNLLNINSSSGNVLPTQQCFTNQPWNFGVGWANDGKQFVCDYASPRSYNSVPASFTALPGSASETLSSAPPQTNVIFQADFKGAGGGTGGANDMVTVGGTGAIIADGVNVKSFVTNANPFTPGGGNYLEVQKITDSGGGLYSPVLFTFASDSNSWDGWQGSNVLDATFGSGECIALHGAQDVFFRVNTNSDSASVGGVNNLFCIRTIEQYSWSDGGNGLKLVLNGQNNGSMIFQIQNAGNNDGLGPDAIVNVTTSGGNISANPLYDIINMNFTDNGNLLTNGLAYHVAFSLNTDTNGLTKAAVYLKQGTGAIDPVQDMQGWATFNIIATNLLNINSSSGNVLPTQQCFTNQPWNFGVGWANDGKQFVCDYASPRSYNSVPASFTALPGSASETLSSAPPQTNVIFQADFKGAGGGTGGANDMVTVGGTGAIIADGINVKSFVTNANPFTPGGGNYLEVQKITDSGGGLYSPVLFTFASDSNSWDGWQGSNVLDATFGSGECIALHGAQDVFFRVNTNSDSASVGGVNNLFCIRTIEQYSWSDGGNGLKLVLNGQNNGSMIFQIQNAGNNDGLGPDAIVNVTTSGGNISANPLYDIINMNF